MRLETSYRGDTDVSVYKSPRHKTPHFIISGADIDRLDKRKIREYLEGCDWSDYRAPGWYPARIRCDDFLKTKKGQIP